MLLSKLTGMALAAALAVTIATPAAAQERSGRMEINGVDYHYQVHGEGEPLLVLHGGLGSFDMFAPILPALTENRQVIGVDLHGHGRTPLGDRPLSLEAIGADMAELVEQLGHEQVDVLGYSFGGGVAFQMAIQEPALVRRLVMLSAGVSQDSFYPEMLAQQAMVGADMAEAMRGTPMYDGYMATAPVPEDFPRLLDAMGAWMRTPYDWSDDVSKLTMPVMLVFGDSDMYRPESIVAFYQRLGGGLRDAGWQGEHMSPNRLAILPGATHYNILMSPHLTSVALPFLNGEPAQAAWGAPQE